MNGNARAGERSRERGREKERDVHTYMGTHNVSYFLAYAGCFPYAPLRAASTTASSHYNKQTKRESGRERAREGESRSAVLSWAAPLAHEGQRQHSHEHEHESKKEKPTQQSRRTGADAAEARLARHGTHWRRTRTLAETSLFSCSWIVKGLGRVTYTVRKVAKTEQSVLSSSDRHNQN